MYINEAVKRFLARPQDRQDTDSSVVHPNNVVVDFDDDIVPSAAFFDDSVSILGNATRPDVIAAQAERIRKYRSLSTIPDVADAIDEIVNEIIFNYDGRSPLKLNFNEENEALAKALNDKFNKISNLVNFRRNLFQIVRQGYIDGSIVMHAAYSKTNTRQGITSIRMIDPTGLYYDAKEDAWKYLNDERMGYRQTRRGSELKYSPEEIVREDFGIYDGEICLSYLEDAIKPANMLKTLEDLLVPLRFSRSISRRVFNVDIGDLPSKRGAEVMREYQNRFKYKKFYNNETGEVTNQQHITSMVEDYWFSNRSGGKGTTVDVLDESGNLGELDDILYMARKLYRALKIPASRIKIDPNNSDEFDYESTTASREDMKFYMFIARLRLVYSSLIKEILRREVIATKTMTEAEWDERAGDIEIVFEGENAFIEKMRLNNFESKLGIYATAQDYQGKLFSVQHVLKLVFKMTDEEIEAAMKEIDAESKNEMFKNFYGEEKTW